MGSYAWPIRLILGVAAILIAGGDLTFPGDQVSPGILLFVGGMMAVGAICDRNAGRKTPIIEKAEREPVIEPELAAEREIDPEPFTDPHPFSQKIAASVELIQRADRALRRNDLSEEQRTNALRVKRGGEQLLKNRLDLLRRSVAETADPKD